MYVADDLTKELMRIKKELERMKSAKIHVGIQGGTAKNVGGNDVNTPADIVTIANVHEFGATITAKRRKNLAIPINKKAKGKSPLDFPGLFFIQSDGLLYGCISRRAAGKKRISTSSPKLHNPKKIKQNNRPIKTGKAQDIEFLFLLVPSTRIPERSFVRAGYDKNKKDIEKACEAATKNIIFTGWDAETAINYIGMHVVNLMQMYLNTPGNFRSKSSITKVTSNWGNNPLIETGRLRNSITYRIEWGN